jgi:lipopolysaccharide transport system ATP-binding protein
MSSEPIIRVRNLSKSFPIYASPADRLKQFIFPRIQRLFGLKVKSYYRIFNALSDISFEVKRGETVGVIGRNGAGKSTLLQILCGTLFPTSGIVEIQGRVAALLELGAGFNGEYTGRENVYMNARILGLTDQEIDARFDDIVKFADIGEHLDQPVKTYSSGMFVRLAFAVVSHVDADILIVDEALAVGDAFFQSKCMRFLRRFSSKGGTLLFVSHEINSVKALCSRALWLNSGKQVSYGQASEVTTIYTSDWLNSQNESVEAEREKSSQKSKEDSLNESTLKLLDISLRLASNNTTANSYAYGDIVSLEINYLALEKSPDLIVSAHIKDRLQQHLIGLTTGCEDNLYKQGVKTNDRINVNFKFPIYLQHGSYTVTLLASRATDLKSYADATFLSWVEAVIAFRVEPRIPMPLSDMIEIPHEVATTIT